MRKTKILTIGLICFFLITCKNPPTTPEPPELGYPNIVYFTATPETIKRGTETTLAWSVENATKTEIDQNIGVVTNQAATNVTPIDDTTYTLIAINNEGGVVKTCIVKVKNGARFTMPRYGWKGQVYTFTYLGTVKNVGTYEASLIKIHVYLYDGENNLLAYDYSYTNKANLKPGAKSSWEIVFWDNERKIRNKLARSEYEITWSENTT